MPAYTNDPRPAFDGRMAIHAFLTLVMLWLGFVLFMPGSTFDGNRSWRLFAQMLPESTWAFLFLVAVIVGGVGLATARRSLRIASALGLATAHGSIALLFFLSNPQGDASGTYGLIALLGYYLGFRHARQGV